MAVQRQPPVQPQRPAAQGSAQAGTSNPANDEAAAKRQLLYLLDQVAQEKARAAAASPAQPAPRAGNTAAGGCETSPVYGTMTQAQKLCNDAVGRMILAPVQLGQLATFCEQRRAAGPYAGMNRQQQQDAVQRGQLAAGWVNTPVGLQPKGCY